MFRLGIVQGGEAQGFLAVAIQALSQPYSGESAPPALTWRPRRDLLRKNYGNPIVVARIIPSKSPRLRATAAAPPFIDFRRSLLRERDWRRYSRIELRDARNLI
jgi:hypothetical protein